MTITSIKWLIFKFERKNTKRKIAPFGLSEITFFSAINHNWSKAGFVEICKIYQIIRFYIRDTVMCFQNIYILRINCSILLRETRLYVCYMYIRIYRYIIKFMICTYNKYKSISSGNIINSHVSRLNRAILFTQVPFK